MQQAIDRGAHPRSARGPVHHGYRCALAHPEGVSPDRQPVVEGEPSPHDDGVDGLGLGGLAHTVGAASRHVEPGGGSTRPCRTPCGQGAVLSSSLSSMPVRRLSGRPSVHSKHERPEPTLPVLLTASRAGPARAGERSARAGDAGTGGEPRDPVRALRRCSRGSRPVAGSVSSTLRPRPRHHPRQLGQDDMTHQGSRALCALDNASLRDGGLDRTGSSPSRTRTRRWVSITRRRSKPLLFDRERADDSARPCVCQDLGERFKEPQLADGQLDRELPFTDMTMSIEPPRPSP